MHKTVETYIAELRTAELQVYKNMAVLPLLKANGGAPDFLLLDQALEQGLIQVTEISKGGSVPELNVINGSKKMVLLLDGEQIVGAKQNRILNTTVLIAPESVTVIPVSCVEQGRWAYAGETFDSCDYMLAAEMRTSKADAVCDALDRDVGYCSNQSAIWNAIDQKARRRKAVSHTMAINAVYEKDRMTTDEYLDHFTCLTGQAGAVFMINGRVAGMDAFSGDAVFAKLYRKLVTSYAIDAVDRLDADEGKQSGATDAEKFIEDVARTGSEVRKSVALGEDIRFRSAELTGFALVYEGRVMHLSAFARTGSARRGSGMQRFSRRRRYVE